MAQTCPIFYSTYSVNDIVRVSWLDGTYTKLRVNWDAVAGATGYNVYGSGSPTTKNLLTPTPITATTFEYTAPQVPSDIMWQFWVSALTPPTTETFLFGDAATLITGLDTFNPANPPQTTLYGQMMLDNNAMAFYVEEMRRRSQAIVENDGEDFDVYLRRWTGAPCPKTDARRVGDPDYDSAQKCEDCYGTGILGGYYYKIRVKARYGDMPNKLIRFQAQGIVLGHDFNSWMLWSPRIHEHDLFVRLITGERFEVAEAAESSWRGFPLHQKMKLILVQAGDIRRKVTDAGITTALTTGPAKGFEKPSIWG